jgi:hypothetical protein
MSPLTGEETGETSPLGLGAVRAAAAAAWTAEERARMRRLAASRS